MTRRTALAVVSTLVLAAPLAGALSAQDAPVVDASLESVTSGQELRLSQERGRRVVVLFYEDRPHLEDNDALKTGLSRYIESRGLDARVVPYGVANLGMLRHGVPHALVRRMVRPLVDRWGAEILLDWAGEMKRAPWNMVGDSSNVVILDRRGRLVWHRHGALSEAQTREFYRQLHRALDAG
ncbi:MAG: YtfJ family protein [Sandaracinaceae bacterium]